MFTMDDFQRSYESFVLYPVNLLQPAVSKRTLYTYAQQLSYLSKKLFVQSSDTFEACLQPESVVGVLDFSLNQGGVLLVL